MVRDGRLIDDGGTVETDVCIIGTGPAGLTVASEFLGSGREVLLLETGGEEPDPAIQALAQGDVVGDPLLDTSMIRHRRIGGNANAWVVKMADGRIGVRHAALERYDLERRSWIEGSGWPIGYDDLVPFYERASATCGCGPFAYEVDSWTRPGAEPWALDPAVASTRVFQFGPRAAFTEVLRAKVDADPTTTLLHHATAVELVLNESGRAVESVRCRHLDGREFTVRARTVVLAQGGLENARLLLMSNRQQPAGVGNGHDLVGRYLQDHPLVDGGSLVPARADVWERSALYDMRLIDGTSVLGHLSLGREVQEREGLLALSASFFPRPTVRRSRGFIAMKDFVERRALGVPKTELLKLAATFATGADYVPIALYRKFRWQQSLYPGFGRGGWSAMPDLARKFVRFEIVHQAEQSPDPTNRVTLGRELDAVGCPRLRVEWRFSRADSAAALQRAGIGTVQLPADDDLPELGTAAGTAHHIGTTRMHDDPTLGVVDRNARLHDVENVYVAGSSIFPTGGYANPTLTITALAHRLGEHLRTR